jgi:hypothetical protein
MSPKKIEIGRAAHATRVDPIHPSLYTPRPSQMAAAATATTDATPIPLYETLFDALTDALCEKKKEETGSDHFVLEKPYFAFRTVDKRYREKKSSRHGHAFVKDECIFDYDAKKSYATVQEWYADRLPKLLTDVHPLPPLSAELVFGRGEDVLSYAEIVRVASQRRTRVHDDSCTCFPCRNADAHNRALAAMVQKRLLRNNWLAKQAKIKKLTARLRACMAETEDAPAMSLREICNISECAEELKKTTYDAHWLSYEVAEKLVDRGALYRMNEEVLGAFVAEVIKNTR